MRPEFVVLGVDNSDGTVTLFASRELNLTELSSEVDRQDVHSVGYAAPFYLTVSVRYSLKTELRTYTTVTAPDYVSAVQSLLASWADPPR